MGKAKTVEESRGGEGEGKGEEAYKKFKMAKCREEWRINILGRSLFGDSNIITLRTTSSQI